MKRQNDFTRKTALMYAEEIHQDSGNNQEIDFNAYSNKELEEYLNNDLNEYNITG